MHIKAALEKQAAVRQDFIHIVILMTVALCLGVYLVGTAVVIAKDGIVFIDYAKNLEINPTQTMIQEDDHPGYPVMLLGVHKIVRLLAEGKSIFSWIYSAQSTAVMFRLLAIVVLYFIGKNLVGAKFSFWAVFILIFLPKPAAYGSDALSDWPHLFFLAAGFLLLIRAAKDSSWPLFGLAGISAGLGYLVRPECAQVVIYGSLWLGLQLFGAKRTLPRSKTVLASALLLVGFLIVAGPYMRLKSSIFPEKQTGELVVKTQTSKVHLSQQQIVSNTTDIIPSDIAGALGKLFENIGETLMWFFVPALLIGLYKSFKKVSWYEPKQFFIIAIIVFNVPLMIWLYCRAGYMSARHTLALVVFTIFYIPAGLEALSFWLDEKFFKKSTPYWGFAVLITIGIAVCSPKLLRPLHYDKAFVHETAQWFVENSERDDIIACEEPRISFYADRKGVNCKGWNAPERARYLVRIFKNPENIPTDKQVGQFRQVSFFQNNNIKNRTIIVYEKSL